MAKLQIPDPEDQRISDVALGILIVIIGMAFLTAYLYTTPAQKNVTTVKTNVAEDPLTAEKETLKIQRAHAMTFKEWTSANLKNHKWTENDVKAVMRFGPRRASEAICNINIEKIVSGTLDKILKPELEKTIDRRTRTAPWTCLMRLFYADKIGDEDLRDELKEFVGELETFSEPPGLAKSFVDDFRETRDRPESERFYHWARLCAFNIDYQPSNACRQLLNQIAPAQGTDLLTSIEFHYAKSGIRTDDIPIIIGTLGVLARNGQPPTWKIKETPTMPDFDVDVRIAAVWGLCRYAHGPNETFAREASSQLAKSGQVGARATAKTFISRWRETCRIVFGGDPESPRPVPFIAVWDGNPDSPTKYDFQNSIDLGYCKNDEGEPMWACAADLWIGGDKPVDIVLLDAFVETRYQTWDRYKDRIEDPKVVKDPVQNGSKPDAPKP